MNVRIILLILTFLFYISGTVVVMAGMQICSCEVTEIDLNRTTNTMVMEIGTDAMRINFGEERSIISLPSASQQIQLFHKNKTYQWQTSQKMTDPNQPSPLPTPTETTLDGYPAKLYFMTNGPQCNHVWVAPGILFSKSYTNGPATVSHQPDLRQRQMIGFPFDSSNIVVATEFIMTTPMVLPQGSDAGNSEPQTTNVVVVLTSKLLSITETNFPDSDFEVPKDYTQADGPPPLAGMPESAKPVLVSPAQKNFDALRKGYQNGQPVIAWPAGFSNPK